MKKFLVVLLCVVMALSAVMAVSAQDNKSASGSTDKDVYIDMWGIWGNDNYRAMYWQEKAAEFCEKYEAETGISVQFEYFGQGGYAKLSVQSGWLPSIFLP